MRFLDHRGRPMMTTGAYDAASRGPRLENWNASSAGINALHRNSLPILRNRSRALHRNNPWVNNGVERLVSNEIGTGIIPRSRCSDLAVRKVLEEQFDLFSDYCDADGVVNFYGMQGSASRARNVSGEVFLRRRIRRASDNLPVNMQVQLLEADYLPVDHAREFGGRNKVKQGIEFNRKGKRVAYWFYKEHPGEDSPNFDGLVRVPARDVIHHYVPNRPGAIRGEPVCVQSMVRSYVFDKYDKHELTRKETQSLFTGFLTKDPAMYDETDEVVDPINHGILADPTQKNNDINVQAGTIIEGFPGEKLDLFSSTDVGASYEPFMTQQLIGLAAGMNIPFEILSGNWKNTNDRLARFILNEFRRGVEMIQDHFMIYQFCRPFYHWYVESMVLDGQISAAGYANNRFDYLRHEWQPHAWDYIHPEQDVNAKIKEMAAGLNSRQRLVARRGMDVEEIDRQRYEDKQREQELGLNDDE